MRRAKKSKKTENKKKTAKTSKTLQLFSVFSQLNFKMVLVSMFFVISMWGLLFAQTDSLECILLKLCNDIMNIIPSLSFLLMTVAAVAYAAGNFFDAQTRARAHVWAMSCIVGAIIGAVIVLVVPAFLGALIKMGVEDTLPEISCGGTGGSGLCTSALEDAGINVT